MSTKSVAARRASPFTKVKMWRARDRHTGIGKDAGVPYTYQHVDGALEAGAAVYRVETYIPFVKPTPLHRDVYYVPSRKLDEFFAGWGQHATIVVDVRPLTVAEALEELRTFRHAAESLTTDPRAAGDTGGGVE